MTPRNNRTVAITKKPNPRFELKVLSLLQKILNVI